jgi:hypothetical protein
VSRHLVEKHFADRHFEQGSRQVDQKIILPNVCRRSDGGQSCADQLLCRRNVSRPNIIRRDDAVPKFDPGGSFIQIRNNRLQIDSDSLRVIYTGKI